ncbi:uncharacterized protein PHALS_04364 [Plasmopara halstedii]|uniref:Uncharacterized protein n=1 Tax=Plasmopara halstedii TaxID=4781 RepID=A0A0P1B136_PLAHL|nr:uncharacterized protein PHALS_04364 [Plasmopara halstedii]CEG47493.1 hypothetical protein PHALS_04364 [Plasmopara halstedii]|eukprot:XP_024583862.1 hypothetical protein PHALS_04364 [Plasmopara halstedii]
MQRKDYVYRYEQTKSKDLCIRDCSITRCKVERCYVAGCGVVFAKSTVEVKGC